jgi:hypothetical protein
MMYVYMACVPECCGTVCCAFQNTGHIKLTLYDIPPVLFCISSNSHGSKKLPDDGRLLLKHVGACILSGELCSSVHCVGCLCYVWQCAVEYKQ